MQAAGERAPDIESYRIALGASLYRLGKFQRERYAEALTTLMKCDKNHPSTLALLVMAQHQLGQQENARANLARLQEVVKNERWAKNSDAQLLLREATDRFEDRPIP